MKYKLDVVMETNERGQPVDKNRQLEIDRIKKRYGRGIFSNNKDYKCSARMNQTSLENDKQLPEPSLAQSQKVSMTQDYVLLLRWQASLELSL